ncbi:ricin-type beta-trefoil lectin domain protein [Streptomyces sp. NBC_00102]|uniref:RICIN domain-containing protein n=1 Tax=Streptomyces sp. NBC_00102 TaxID=2975652 RepID=UPI00224DE7E8|nr:ricin-type beta-trefoil lectin domain protein [Streptomyces sp. NBC_00102]MCX5397854.1 ricin-type beta-trefoil lectin domain protein [Streptomyces sp. NBC_00102]
MDRKALSQNTGAGLRRLARPLCGLVSIPGLRRLATSAAAVGLLATGVLVALGSIGPADSAQAAGAVGTTPATYTAYAFTGSPVLTDVSWSTTVRADPGHGSQVFWSHRFAFDGGSGGYIGMQSNGGSGRGFLFSVRDASQAVFGSYGSYCQSFRGEEARQEAGEKARPGADQALADGPGGETTCRMPLDWTAGHTYAFTVASEGGGWFGATVRDTTAGTSFELGSVLTPATAISAAGMVDRTEYIERNDSRATCYDQPLSIARSGLPTANGGALTARVSGTSNNANACAPMTRTDIAADGTEQILAIGNSVRGAVTGLAGKCLGPRGGFTDGTAAALSTCAGYADQAWVRAADGTLRLRSDYCLAASGTAASSAVLVRDCAGTGTGGAVTDSSKLWTYDTATNALVNEASGLCLCVPDANSTDGRTLVVHACTGSPEQRWTPPAGAWPKADSRTHP